MERHCCRLEAETETAHFLLRITADPMIQWHRLFGMTLTDFFTDTAYTVELEKDLSLKQQLLDVVIIEKGTGPPPAELPDGLEDMAPHNLMTYKSHQQALDWWSLDELTGHFVNYRKSFGPKTDSLLPMEEFQLYAVSARYPEKLAGEVEFRIVKSGVYDVRWGIRDIRMIVLSRISEDRRNAVWHLFSAVPETVAFGVSEYRWRSPVSSVINELFRKYKTEGVIAMPYTIEDYQKDYVREHLDKLSPEDVLEKFSMEELLKGIPRDRLFDFIEKKFSKLERKKLLEMLNRLKTES